MKKRKRRKAEGAWEEEEEEKGEEEEEKGGRGERGVKSGAHPSHADRMQWRQQACGCQ